MVTFLLPGAEITFNIRSLYSPPNWKGLLSSSENKRELFLFLTGKITGMFNTSGGEVKVDSTDADVTRLYPCSHEEAETRIFIHVELLLHVGTHLLR